jgi:transcriptional regulator with XRE-family HTH domain
MGRRRAPFREGTAEAERDYAQTLRDIRDHRGETQQELGRLLGCSVSMVSRFEAATERPDMATHRRYCALAPTEELHRRATAAYQALPPDGSRRDPPAVRRSPEEWHGRALDGPGVYRLLEAMYPAYPLLRLFGDEAKPLPVWAELAPAEQWADVEAPLGQLDLSQPPPDVRTWRCREPCDPRGEAQFKRHLADWDRQLREIQAGRRTHLDTWNQLTYDLHTIIRDEQGRVQLDCKLGTYYHSLSTSESLDPELLEAYAAWPDSQREQVWPRLERRAWLHDRVPDPVADGRYRSAAIGVSTLTIVRVRTRSFDGYKLFLSPRSVTAATQRRRYHVVPSGMFQPFIPGDSSDLLQDRFSVSQTVMREFVEELYGVEELETGDGRVDPQAIYRRREARLLSDLLSSGDAALLYSGVAVNLLAVRPEICTVLIIRDPIWYERECGELRICGEYLQQCQQAELLPDQRWVQLINLDRDDLELDPWWREQLRARTVVAPGVAAIDLGLRVARSVVTSRWAVGQGKVPPAE